MNDYGMSYDQVRHYLKQGKIQSQLINGDLRLHSRPLTVVWLLIYHNR